jgi:hypothetical protein
MGCGCGGSKKKKYVVTTKLGRTETVDSLSAAMAVIRREGGKYQPIRV